MSAYYIGLKTNTALATTMAFATLTIARLFHGFNCRGKESIRKLKLKTNPYQIMAFVAGIAFISIVLFVPQLHGLFEIADFTTVNILEILGLAFCADTDNPNSEGKFRLLAEVEFSHPTAENSNESTLPLPSARSGTKKLWQLRYPTF